MNQSGINVWFVCKLCRGSFRQVDNFIEHKKEKHFTDFQKTSCIVFEERDYDDSLLGPVIIKAENQLTDENIEPPTKIEVPDASPSIPFGSEIIDEPNLAFVEPKSELITFERETTPVRENNCISLKQPAQNPYVLLKRLTSDEIQRACFPKQHSRLLKFEQKNFADDSESDNSFDVDSNISDHIEVKKSTKIQPIATLRNIMAEKDLQLECKLCSKQLESDAHRKIHVGICALYHKDRNRYCVTCNRKFSNKQCFKLHCVRRHGPKEEKSLLHRFKCHMCPKRYETAQGLRCHLETHREKKEPGKTSGSTQWPKYSDRYKCWEPNCGKVWRDMYKLRRHMATHLGFKPFSCPFPDCDKTFSQSIHVKHHLVIHTGERPYICPMENCGKGFPTFNGRTEHHRRVHCKL